MITVRQILEKKGSDVHSVGPEMTVYDALKVMAQKNVGAVLVRSGGTLVGILSERDYARKVILLGKASKETPVGEIMTSKIVYARPDLTATEALALMTDKHIRHLPVMEQERLIGVVSIGDLVKAIISEQEFNIRQLENYIIGPGH
ncbi:MAG: histidine kinase [Planctomycetes bacterium RBG_16_59_8]|nr:MAG: histidine kinase [Planctomycetes bacterium RBG_16_59_8]